MIKNLSVIMHEDTEFDGREYDEDSFYARFHEEAPHAKLTDASIPNIIRRYAVGFERPQTRSNAEFETILKTAGICLTDADCESIKNANKPEQDRLLSTIAQRHNLENHRVVTLLIDTDTMAEATKLEKEFRKYARRMKATVHEPSFHIG